MIKIFVKFALVLSLTACVSNQQKNTYQHPVSQQIVQQPNIEIYFTPSLDCEKAIIKRINNSETIDIAVYSITNPNITDAIINAHNRGANIRIITDRGQSKIKGSKVEQIRETGIQVLTNKKHKIEHNKFAIFDNIHMVTGSYNWTTNASNNNSENCLFFDQPNKEYSHRFEYLWSLYSK